MAVDAQISRVVNLYKRLLSWKLHCLALTIANVTGSSKCIAASLLDSADIVLHIAVIVCLVGE